MPAETNRQGHSAPPDLFEEWNRDVVSLFEDQVARSPMATAVIDGDAVLEYRELDRRANRLAHRLVALGVEPGSQVAICVERSLASIVGILAIVKCGAAYVPIDHRYPTERIRFMLHDSAASHTVTVRTMDRSVLVALVHPVYVDDDHDDEVALRASASPDLAIAPDSAAYVMYTSGTSGAPKGVAIPHSGIVRLVWHSNYIDLDARDVILHHATCSFDAATFEIWAALLNGGRLVIHRDALALDAIAGLIERHGITTLLLTTSVFHLVAEHEPHSLAGLKTLVTGGDVMQARAVRRVLEHNPGIILINGYGPTENTTFTCCYVITRDTPLGDTVPIGKPISGTNVVVLDATMCRVRVGEAGQLYTSGLGMGKGYRNREDINRESFVASPFPEFGPLLYRTGDLVREDARGDFHFIGRIDRQVKIRGFRIEPGEIEHALNLRPDVAESVVVAEATGEENKRLVGYVQRGDPRATLDEHEIKRDLATRIPGHMVPSRIHVLDQFPLTLNGKIDKERLAALVAAELGTAPEPVAERTAGTVSIVLDAWRSQLREPALPADASVYDYGASSLTMMAMQTELNRRLSCAVTLGKLVVAQTPLDWANIYDRHLRFPRDSSGSGTKK